MVRVGMGIAVMPYLAIDPDDPGIVVRELTADGLNEGFSKGKITAMAGVPALWQMLERRILTQVAEKGPVATRAFDVARRVLAMSQDDFAETFRGSAMKRAMRGTARCPSPVNNASSTLPSRAPLTLPT